MHRRLGSNVFLLNKVRTIVVDPVNNLGFSPLMKAALQGRIKCSKLLLFSGRNRTESRESMCHGGFCDTVSTVTSVTVTQ